MLTEYQGYELKHLQLNNYSLRWLDCVLYEYSCSLVQYESDDHMERLHLAAVSYY